MLELKSAIVLVGLSAILIANAAISGSATWPDRIAHIKDTMVFPASAKANAALKLAVENPKQACIEAGSAASLMNQASSDAHQLLQEMTTEKKDDKAALSLADELDANAKSFVRLRDEVCSGRLAQTETSPTTQKFAQLLGTPIKAYTDDLMEANAAANLGDKSGMCLAFAKGQGILITLRINLAKLRETAEADGSGEALDLFETRLTGFETSMAQRLKTCAS